MTDISKITYEDYLEYQNSLMHYGVKGMRWGRRKANDEPKNSGNYGYKTVRDARRTEYSKLKGLGGNMTASTGLAVAGNAAGRRGLVGVQGAALTGAYGNMIRSSYKTYQKQGLSKGEAMGMAIMMGPVGNVAVQTFIQGFRFPKMFGGSQCLL